MRGISPKALVSRKGGRSNSTPEVSETTKVCTDEQKAIQQSQRNINEGYKHIVEIDLKSFFDEVDHAISAATDLPESKMPNDPQADTAMAQSTIVINGKLTKRRKGTPQGSPLSPLLSNILLHELDEFLEAKGQKFVRYADDFSIYTKSKSKAKSIGNQVFLFLKDKLKLPINRGKSGIRNPANFQILGHGVTSSFEMGSRGIFQLIVAEKSWKKLKTEIKEITSKTTPYSFQERIRKLNLLQCGWLNYFQLGRAERQENVRWTFLVRSRAVHKGLAN